jgi:hypothetical protein
MRAANLVTVRSALNSAKPTAALQSEFRCNSGHSAKDMSQNESIQIARSQN